MNKLLLALILFSGAAFAQSGVGMPALDAFGGVSGKACTSIGAANHWYTELSANGRWHFCSPAASGPGNWAFYIAGANVFANPSCTVDSGSTYSQRVAQKYNNTTIACGTPAAAIYCKWGGVVTKKMLDWGFNATSFAAVSYTNGWDRITACNGIVPIASGFNGSSGAAWASGINPYRIATTAQINPAVYAVKNAQSYISDGPVKDIAYAINTANSGISASSTQMPDVMDSRYTQWLAGDITNDRINGPLLHFGQCFADPSYCVMAQVDQHDNLRCSGPPYLTTGAYPSEPTGKNDIHCGWLALVSAPYISTNGNKKVSTNVQIYPDDINYTKQALVAFLTAKYGTIGALNTAWGTSYTAFGSARTHVTGEVCATGDGATNSFTCTLAHANVDPYSVRIKVATVSQGGDCPKTTTGCSTAPAGGGNMLGTCASSANDPCAQTNGVSGGSMIYATGVITAMTFASAPANLASITVDYDYGGFTYATTLADEDGGKGAKTGCTDFTELNGCNATILADLNSFMYNSADAPAGTNGTTTMWGYYFRSIRAAIKAADANMLYGCSYYQAGQWRTPAHDSVLKAAGAFCDVFQDTMDWTASGNAARMAHLFQNLGDIPVVQAQYINYTADSRLNGGVDPQAGSPMSFSTAGAAGAGYASELNSCYSSTNAQGHNACVGYSFWNGMAEQKGVVENGLVSTADNPYDGNPRNTGPYTDDYGYSNNITAGATESQIWGDFLSPVIHANQKVMWQTKAGN